MGFFIMLCAAIVGVLLVSLSVLRKVPDQMRVPIALAGLVLLGVAIWLALPK